MNTRARRAKCAQRCQAIPEASRAWPEGIAGRERERGKCKLPGGGAPGACFKQTERRTYWGANCLPANPFPRAHCRNRAPVTPSNAISTTAETKLLGLEQGRWRRRPLDRSPAPRRLHSLDRGNRSRIPPSGYKDGSGKPLERGTALLVLVRSAFPAPVAATDLRGRGSLDAVPDSE